ncbi:MAG: protein kinase, partial [Planctomycetes bacterium]|nr:protein kinase [Planctomycetota bacterium]
MIGSLANNRYRILAELGSGGAGVVYRVADTAEQDREIALKVLVADAQNPDLVEHFRHEFGLMTRLRHPNLPEVYDFGVLDDGGSRFFTCELVRGKGFLAATAGRPVHEICELAVQLCRVLEYIHSRSLVHYDVKPSNILVADAVPSAPAAAPAAATPAAPGRRIVKLLDLGTAAEARDESGAPLIGTLAYMAPEIARGEPVDRRADLYSLGVSLYQAFTGKLPFKAVSGVEMLWQHMETKVEPPSTLVPGFPRALDGVLLRLLSKDPADRFPTANRVIEAISDALDERFELETRETRAGYIASSRFVGRSKALAAAREALRARCRPAEAARAALDSAAARPPDSVPPLLLVSGERGSGKSRLARELKYEAQLAGIRWAQGTFHPGARALFAPCAELLRALLPLSAPDDEELAACGPDLVKLVPDCAARLGITPSPPLDPERERLRIFGRFAEYLAALSRRVPLVVWLDGLHWADAASIELLHFLVRYLDFVGRARNRPRPGTALLPGPSRLLLGANRNSDHAAPPEVERLLAALRDEGLVTDVTLGPLNETEIGSILESMLGAPAAPQAFVRRLAGESGGNPFLVEEILRALVDAGVPMVRGGAWAIGPDELDRIRLPATIGEALRARMDCLERVNLPVLRVLALADAPMPTHWIARAAGMQLSLAVSLLSSLAVRGLVRRERAGDAHVYALTSNSLKAHLAGDLPEEECRTLHRRLAALIEADERTPLEERVEALAYHYTQAAAFDKCIQYAAQAAERAARLGFRAKALETVQFALDALEMKAVIGRKLTAEERGHESGLYRMRGRLEWEAG